MEQLSFLVFDRRPHRRGEVHIPWEFAVPAVATAPRRRHLVFVARAHTDASSAIVMVHGNGNGMLQVVCDAAWHVAVPSPDCQPHVAARGRSGVIPKRNNTGLAQGACCE